jgi:phosphatidylglycerophosphatase A
LLITSFGLGHMRPASGTWGSLPPVVLAGCLWLAGLSPQHPGTPTLIYHAALLAVFLIFAIACVKFGAAAEAKFGHDPKEVVADETSAQCLPLLFLPAASFSTFQSTALTLASAFLLFRIFDIWKPWPAHQLQRVPGGWGILLDDLFAALYAAALLQLAIRLLL